MSEKSGLDALTLKLTAADYVVALLSADSV